MQNAFAEDPRKFSPHFPMEPRTALLHMSKYMLELEKTEILAYDIVYYLNVPEGKKG